MNDLSKVHPHLLATLPPLLLDLVQNQPEDDRKRIDRRVLHSCGHYSNDSIWGKYRAEERFAFSATQECPVCMTYSSAKHCFDYTDKNFGKNKHTGFASMWAMINVAEEDDVSA